MIPRIYSEGVSATSVGTQAARQEAWEACAVAVHEAVGGKEASAGHERAVVGSIAPMQCTCRSPGRWPARCTVFSPHAGVFTAAAQGRLTQSPSQQSAATTTAAGHLQASPGQGTGQTQHLGQSTSNSAAFSTQGGSTQASPTPATQAAPANSFWADDEAIEREIQAFTPEEVAEISRQLEQQLYEEVVAEELRQWQALEEQHYQELLEQQGGAWFAQCEDGRHVQLGEGWLCSM